MLLRFSRFMFCASFMLTCGMASGQAVSVTISGSVKSGISRAALPFANVVLKAEKDSTFVTGTVTDEAGMFRLTGVKPGNYLLEVTSVGYAASVKSVFVGSVSEFLDLGTVELGEAAQTLAEVTIDGKANEVSSKMDRKVFSLNDNVSQVGGSVLQAMQNLPGITVQDGKVQLRGSDKVIVLMDGKQTALTGFGSQAGLDNLPASAIDKIEVITNPSAKYDANGNAGIINIVMKKSRKEGFNGKVGLTTGLGALWVRKENLPTIRPQYTATPKVNPSLSLNYRRNKVNTFLQLDNLYTQTLNKNEFVTRTYTDGTIIRSQLKRNRNTNFFTSKAGIDWNISDDDLLTVSGLFGTEKILDRGDQPFFNADLTKRNRLWKFLEDELKTTVMATAAYQHKFKQAGHQLNAGVNYTFHREDEKYFYDNILPVNSGTDTFKLIADEKVFDFNLDYVRPLRYGRLETGFKLRNRVIPTDMVYVPGPNSVLDLQAGGWATYRELIPALYGNYIFETQKLEAELGLRMEYVKIKYDVNPDHRTYKSDGYDYTQPFPSFRLSYKLGDNNKVSVFYNRRVDRPNERDIRIFPKYDDAEIIKVGNPALRPQFTNSVELGFKHTGGNGYFYSAIYHRFAKGTMTRISSMVPGDPIIYNIFQNTGRSYNTGIEAVVDRKVSGAYSFNLNGNIYRNQIDAFTVHNLYPEPNTFSADKQTAISGSVKMNNNFRLVRGWDAQLSGTWLAPDIIPQGKVPSRFSLDAGAKKSIQHGKGELFVNANDILNTMVTAREIRGDGFSYISKDYNETQVIRIGYSYKF